MKLSLTLFALTAAAILALWGWIGAPIDMPPGANATAKVNCVSYAPFRDDQTPLDPSTRIDLGQIEDDLARLAPLTGCIRTYSTDLGLDQIAGVAERFGLKVIQGLWVSGVREKTRLQIDTAIALARRYPHVITSVVVGNEALLRGEISANELGAAIREVKAAVPVPVTYADVWEFWLRNRSLAADVDFVTVHILPYWEDFPIPAREALAHIDAIRRQVAAAFPGKDILIGEVGWPSAGRMREGAEPSPANQAMVLQAVTAWAERGGYPVNLIEAFDQPWKRVLEGAVGGHWGLFTAGSREMKFAWGRPVSNHPYWPWEAAGGIALAGIVFAAAFRANPKAPQGAWFGVALNALSGGVMAGWVIENVPIESLGFGGWTRGVILAVLAVAVPVIASAALTRGVALPVFAATLGRAESRPSDPLARAAGALLVAVVVLAIQTALGLVFDPRYRDFVFPALTATVVPFLVQVVMARGAASARGRAEVGAATLLFLSAVFIAVNETFANWQAVWLCATLVALALTLVLRRDARSS
jgi:glucan 1,3-beta-glucosidase